MPPMPLLLLQQHRRAHHVTIIGIISSARAFSVRTVSVTHDRHHHGPLRDQESEAGRLSLRQTTEHTDHTLKEKARGATMADEENFSYVCAPWAPVLGFMGCASAIIFASEFRSLRASCWFSRNGAWERSPSNDGRSGPVLSTDRSVENVLIPTLRRHSESKRSRAEGVSVEEHWAGATAIPCSRRTV